MQTNSLLESKVLLFTACKDDEEKPAEETYTDVKSVYSLSTATDNSVINPAGLSIESARKDKKTGVTTIMLSGTIDSGIPRRAW
ncbi:hypothetical protein PilKf_00186 [Pillotina sp. SPG140]|jgi:hypothetical protein